MAKQDNMNSGKRAGGVGHIFAVIGKIVGTILLTAFLTALIFACLFAVYVKNDLSEQAQWASDSFSMEQTSVIYYEDPDTGKYEVLQAIYGGSYCCRIRRRAAVRPSRSSSSKTPPANAR